MKRLAREHAGQVLIVKVNVKDSPAVARRFEVTRTPAVAAVRVGQTLTVAESAGEAALAGHVAYLLGRGPKPEPARAPQAERRPRPAQATEATGTGRPLAVTDATFDEMVLRSPQPVLVDFWAPWCGPCRMIEPAVENLARDAAGRMRVAKVNVDENPAVASRYQVHGIPTMMVVKGGQIVERWSGALPEPALKSRVMRWVRD
jgi:thioredoxin 1